MSDADEQKALLTAPDGTRFHVSIDDGKLWVHVEARDDAQQAFISGWDANAANEGWLCHFIRLRPGSAPLAPRPR